jgi:hypothetical protein
MALASVAKYAVPVLAVGISGSMILGTKEYMEYWKNKQTIDHFVSGSERIMKEIASWQFVKRDPCGFSMERKTSESVQHSQQEKTTNNAVTE